MPSGEAPNGESPAADLPVSREAVEASGVARAAAGREPATAREQKSFWAEFQSHPVYRVGVLYAVAGWAVVQASDIALDAFEAPHWMIKSVLIASVAGFPIALLVARMLHPTLQAAPARRTWLVKGLAVMILGVTFAASIFIARRMLSRNAALPVRAAAGERVASLAVLPLARLMPNEDPTFAEGMHEDLITRLASIRDLHVISREVMLPFRDSKQDSTEIGRDLGAAYVLSGSVRRADNELRINARLVETERGTNLWAKTYDRHLTDVFKLQSELSTDIAQSLTPVLTPAERKQLQEPVSASVEAYDLFLKASNNRDWRQAEQDLERAVELDPKFARAWSELGSLRANVYQWNAIHTPEQLQKARAAIDRALSLAPEDPVVRVTTAFFFGQAYRDWARTYREVKLVVDQQPNSADLAGQLSDVATRRGDLQEAVRQLERGRRLEPVWPVFSEGLGRAYRGLRRYDEARKVYAQMRAANQLTFEAALGSALAEFQATRTTTEFERFVASLSKEERGVPGQARRLRDVSWQLGLLPLYLELAGSVPVAPPDDSDLQQIMLGLALFESQDGATGKQLVERVRDGLQQRVRDEPDNATLWSLLGMSLAMTGSSATEAVAAGRRAVQLIPREVDAWVGPHHLAAYACTLAWTGDLAGSVAQLEQVLGNYYHQSVGFYLPTQVAHLSRGLAWKPLRGFPAFEALLANPQYSSPL